MNGFSNLSDNESCSDGRENVKIFIVQNSRTARRTLAKELAGIDGITLCGMEQEPGRAIRSIREMGPDLVIIDLGLYSGNGFEVMKRLTCGGPGAKILVLTDSPHHHNRMLCREMGADFFFDKTLELDKALQTIRGMIRE